MTSTPLHGKTALITGASSGLGKHFAQTLASAGAQVILCARRQDRLDALAAQLHEQGHSAHAVVMDVTDAASVDAALDKAFAIAPIDILINNAGVATPVPILDQDEAHWRHIMDTNLDGAWRVARGAATRIVAAQTPATIINIASVAGFTVGGQLSAYAASKAALIHFTKAMALELGRYKIRVNAIAPGYFSTEMNTGFLESPMGQRMLKHIPAGRFGELEDLDGPLLLLASDAGRHITGHCLVVDGGHSLAGTH